MINNKKIIVLLLAYNAASFIFQTRIETLDFIPKEKERFIEK